MYSSDRARQDMESVLHHPDMTKIKNGNSFREEDEEKEDVNVNADMEKCYDKYPNILPVEPLKVG